MTAYVVYVCVMLAGIVEFLLLDALTDPYQIWLVVLSTQRLEIEGGDEAPSQTVEVGWWTQPPLSIVGYARDMVWWKNPKRLGALQPPPLPLPPKGWVGPSLPPYMAGRRVKPVM